MIHSAVAREDTRQNKMMIPIVKTQVRFKFREDTNLGMN